MTATAAPQASKHWPASVYRRPDGEVERGLAPARLREIVRAGEGELWVDVDSNDLPRGSPSTGQRPTDHTTRLMESVDTPRDLLAGVLETYLSQTSNRMNRVMKQLSISLAIVWWLKRRQWL